MALDVRYVHHALTLADYRRLEAQGQITRPLTDRPIKLKRTADAPTAPEHPSKGDDTPKVKR